MPNHNTKHHHKITTHTPQHWLLTTTHTHTTHTVQCLYMQQEKPVQRIPWRWWGRVSAHSSTRYVQYSAITFTHFLFLTLPFFRVISYNLTLFYPFFDINFSLPFLILNTTYFSFLEVLFIVDLFILLSFNWYLIINNDYLPMSMLMLLMLSMLFK